MKLRTLAAASAAVLVASSLALAGQLFNFPSASTTATSRNIATLPMTGLECIPGDTNNTLGQNPNQACYTQGNIKGNYIVTLTDAATVTPSVSGNANLYQWTLGGSRTMGVPTGAQNGQHIRFLIVQDATGSRTLTWPSNFKWPAKTGGATTAPTLSTTASVGDLFSFTYDGTNWLSGSNQTTGQALVP